MDKQLEAEMKLLDFNFSQFQNTEVVDPDLEEIKRIISSVNNLNNQLRRLHLKSKNTELKLLMEHFFSWSKTFINLIK